MDSYCRFSLKEGRDENGDVKTNDVTVAYYFEKLKGIPLHDSADLPCINVGKPKRPSYFPIEVLNF